jgi:hypothetical protein
VDVPKREDRARRVTGERRDPGDLRGDRLRVRATGVIGSRVHPVTGVLIVYVAAELAGEPDVAGTCSDELAEIRWIGLAEAVDLMSSMFEAVRWYLQRVLKG